MLSGSYGIHASLLCREQLQIFVVVIALSIEYIQISIPMVALFQRVTTHELHVNVSMQEDEIGHGNEMFNGCITLLSSVLRDVGKPGIGSVTLVKSGRRNSGAMLSDD